MKLSKCNNGHYYDSDIFECCPHCGNLPPVDDSLPTEIRKAGLKTDREVEAATATGRTFHGTQVFNPLEEISHEDSEGIDAEVYNQSLPGSDDVCLFDESSDEECTEHERFEFSEENSKRNDISANPETVREIEQYLQSASMHAPSRLVVGWFVRRISDTESVDYTLTEGRNFILSNGAVDCNEFRDPSDAYACVEYFRENNEFTLSITSSCRVWVNDVERADPVRLCSRDIIRTESDVFVFVALCERGFFW